MMPQHLYTFSFVIWYPMKVTHWFPLVVLGSTLIAGCSYFNKLVYKIDIPQGNYLEQREVDKLRVDMTREQVAYVLGTPMTASAFNNDVWHYIYSYKNGRGKVYKKEMTLTFKDDRLVSAEGDFKLPDNFNTPLDDESLSPVATDTAETAANSAANQYRWIIEVGAYDASEDAALIAEELRQAHYQVQLQPDPPVSGAKTYVYAEPAADRATLTEKLTAIQQLVHSDTARIVAYPKELAPATEK